MERKRLPIRAILAKALLKAERDGEHDRWCPGNFPGAASTSCRCWKRHVVKALKLERETH
jgi:hypothetical protein